MALHLYQLSNLAAEGNYELVVREMAQRPRADLVALCEYLVFDDRAMAALMYHFAVPAGASPTESRIIEYCDMISRDRHDDVVRDLADRPRSDLIALCRHFADEYNVYELNMLKHRFAVFEGVTAYKPRVHDDDLYRPFGAPSFRERQAGEWAEAAQDAAQRGERNKDAYFAVLGLVEKIVERHAQVLLTKRRLKLFTGEYGELVDREWRSEIDYFIRHVVMTALVQEGHGELLEGAERFARDEECAPLAVRLAHQIDIMVSTLDTQEPEDSPGEPTFSTPAEYEQFCAHLLSSAGWSVHPCGGSGDQGVDIVAERDGKTAVFQCKMYSKPVGNTAVQEVYTGMKFYSAQQAIVVTSSDFTPGARIAAERTGVVLLHHSQLPGF